MEGASVGMHCLSKQGAESNDLETTIDMPVRRLSGELIGVFNVALLQKTLELKNGIAGQGGPAVTEQKLIAGHKVLCDTDVVSEAWPTAGGVIFLVEEAGCPTCQGPCSCNLCDCAPQFGLIDYYGTCKACGRCGGHGSACQFCKQKFPSLCALDTHVRFAHNTIGNWEWNNSRLDQHLKQRGSIDARYCPAPEPETFLEACRGGL